MIVLDTHIWVWWVTGDAQLSAFDLDSIRRSTAGVAISAISVWEVAKKAAAGKLVLDRSLDDWMGLALSATGLHVLPLSVEVLMQSARLPGEIHRDPADQIIAATCMVRELPLLTRDRRLIAYPHVTTLA